MANVTLKNICKDYGKGNRAVTDVTIEIKNKEFVVLVGPSGCGKSTTLRMIAGLEEISSGELFIDEKVMNSIPPKDRDIAMVFQNYALYPHMSVFDNISFGLKIRKFSKEEIIKRVSEAAKILGLEEYLKRKPKELSGGQRQRVALGRAIVRQPKVFLFDEPLSNLDAKLRVQMRTEISKLHKKLEATIVYVTHDQVEAMTMGDRIVVMNKGVVQQVAPPIELYQKPVNKFVAGFIGSPAMNFIQGTILKNEKLLFKSDKGSLVYEIPSADESRLSNYAGKKAWIGIRPEDIYHSSANNVDTTNFAKINIKIDLVEPMGNETFIYFSLDDILITARISARDNSSFQTNSAFAVDLSKVFYFDSESEIRI
ncbi:MAG: sn-glycerol-3-phosphate ABC transporter ATP-binding protein UgpC [Ignavibacteriaceae bacterium]|nr:sn-glycerol-3-phosphate ABC transporter ATP-binding protein UgpC [Ignavibacteriaceae bacterium]